MNRQRGFTPLERRISHGARHKKGCNVLYLDWHVGWMAAEEMRSFEK